MTGVRFRHARRLATEACRMLVAKVKALPAAFVVGDLYPTNKTWWHPGKVWWQYVRPLKKHPYMYLLGSLEGMNYDSIDGPLCIGRTLQEQGSRKHSHPIRLGQYKGVRFLARSVVMNHHLTTSNNLRLHFRVCAFLSLGATYPASYEFRI